MEQLSRKILFLYPDALSISDEKERRILNNCVNSLNLISISVNEAISGLLSQQDLPGKSCHPSIELQVVDQYLTSSNFFLDPTNKNGLRICMTKLNNYDYSEAFIKLISGSERSKHGISHLVELNISTSCERVRWSVPENSSFDAVAETDLENLESIIISIMLDIMLYHSFCLPNDYDFRKSFSEKKSTYILNKFGRGELEKCFGSEQDELRQIRYLPISLIHITKHPINIDSEYTDLVLDYTELIIDHVLCSISIKKDSFVCGKSNTGNNEQEVFDKHKTLIRSAIMDYKKGKEDNCILIFYIGESANALFKTGPSYKLVDAKTFGMLYVSMCGNQDIYFYRIKK